MIGLSNSTLQVFQDCPRCFWLAKVKKIERPRGIFPSLPKGIDRVMKAYTEKLVVSGKRHPYLGTSSAIPHPDRKMLQKFQSWRTFQGVFETPKGPVKAWGELDDLLWHPNQEVSPWDYKSKGDSPDDAEEYTRKYYQLQADMYALLVGAQGLKCSGFVYFTYTWPVIVDGQMIEFDYVTCRIASDTDRALKVLGNASACLDGAMPASGPDCEYCNLIEARKGVGA